MTRRTLLSRLAGLAAAFGLGGWAKAKQRDYRLAGTQRRDYHFKAPPHDPGWRFVVRTDAESIERHLRMLHGGTMTRDEARREIELG